MSEQTERLRLLAWKLRKNNPLSTSHDIAASGIEEACNTIDEMEQAVTDSTIALLHRFGISGAEAEQKAGFVGTAHNGHNAELRGAKPTGEASRSNDVLGVD